MSEGNGVTPAPVTARGVIRGEPAALAGVSSARGRAVLAYCEKVCGHGASLGAAVEAFARFRSTAFHAHDPLALNPDELLLSSTRRAAAGCVTVPERNRTALCPEIPMLLAENACGTLTARNRDRLRRHLARCPDCRDLEQAQQAGERAYRDPGDRPLSEHEHAVIFASLATAVPSHALNGGDPVREEEPALPADAVTALTVHEEEEVVAEPAPPPPAERPRTTKVLRGDAHLRQPVEPPPVAESPPRRRVAQRDWRGLTSRVLAPVAVVVAAALAALALAGVFGSSGGTPHTPTVVTTARRGPIVILPATPVTPLPPARHT
jgi:hypothetical protein